MGRLGGGVGGGGGGGGVTAYTFMICLQESALNQEATVGF